MGRRAGLTRGALLVATSLLCGCAAGPSKTDAPRRYRAELEPGRAWELDLDAMILDYEISFNFDGSNPQRLRFALEREGDRLTVSRTPEPDPVASKQIHDTQFFGGDDTLDIIDETPESLLVEWNGERQIARRVEGH